MAGHLPLLSEDGTCKLDYGLDGLNLEQTHEVINEVKGLFELRGLPRTICYMGDFTDKKNFGDTQIGRILKLSSEYSRDTAIEKELGTLEVTAFGYSPLLHREEMVGQFEVHFSNELSNEKILQIFYVA